MHASSHVVLRCMHMRFDDVSSHFIITVPTVPCLGFEELCVWLRTFVLRYLVLLEVHRYIDRQLLLAGSVQLLLFARKKLNMT